MAVVCSRGVLGVNITRVLCKSIGNFVSEFVMAGVVLEAVINGTNGSGQISIMLHRY